MTKPTKDQFEFPDPEEPTVRHKPTGAKFSSSYRYTNPEHTAITYLNWGKAGDVLNSGEDYNRGDVMALALELLRERSREEASKGQ